MPGRLRVVLVHVSVWVTLATIMQLYNSFAGRDFNMLIAIPNIIYILLFYLNYSILIEKQLFKGKVWSYIITNVVIFIALFYLLDYLGEFLRNNTNFPHDELPPERGRGNSAFGHTLFGILVIAPSLSIKMTIKWFEARQKIQHAEKMRIEMELTSLKNQLNPHFLFNSLNNIYALIQFNPELAQTSLLSVCDLLRYQLYDSDYTEVELEKEVQFINNYCELMRLRLGESVKVSVELPSDNLGIKIAPLLFISLVENAFKHGVDSDKGSHISINLSVVGDVVRFSCVNSNYPKSTKDRSGSGIGLVNLVRRLELIYPNSHTYDVKVVDYNYITTLIINTSRDD